MSAAETDKRRLARAPSRFAVTCSSAGAQSGARLRDITPLGCSLRTDETVLAEGYRVQLRIARLSSMEGEVIWRDGRDAGIAFACPLHPAVAEFIALRIAPERVTDMVHRDRFGRALPALEGRTFGLTRGRGAR